MTLDHFTLEIKDQLGHLSFNRTDKSNALHMEAWHELKRSFEYLSDHEEVRAIILAGQGKHFCAGIDLALLMDINRHDGITCEARKREHLRKFIFFLQDSITAIERCAKPVIAAVHGGCIGGGVDIIAACDMRYATDDAYFTIKEVDMGLVADIGTLQRLPKIIPPGIMAELAYTGRKVSGTEAAAIHMVNQSFVSREDLMTHVHGVAATIAAKSPLVIRGIKENLLYTRDHSVTESLTYVANYNAAYVMSDDLMESFSAQMERRTPVYKD